VCGPHGGIGIQSDVVVVVFEISIRARS